MRRGAERISVERHVAGVPLRLRGGVGMNALAWYVGVKVRVVSEKEAC